MKSKEGEESLIDDYIDFEFEIETILTNLTSEQIWMVGYKTAVNQPIFKRRDFIQDLIDNLQKGGVNIVKISVLLGIDVTNVMELSPSDFGMLLRYLWINDRSALSVVAHVLMNYPKLISSIITYSAG
jgi:hypothetical protein